MAVERRVLCLGLDSSLKENKDEMGLDQEIKINKYNFDKIQDILNIVGKTSMLTLWSYLIVMHIIR